MNNDFFHLRTFFLSPCSSKKVQGHDPYFFVSPAFGDFAASFDTAAAAPLEGVAAAPFAGAACLAPPAAGATAPSAPGAAAASSPSAAAAFSFFILNLIT